MPIAAFIFGGRRARTVPLVYQAFNWTYGVYIGRHDGLGDDRRRRPGNVGQVRRDPFAMLPFCGYHMADYFSHWLNFGRQLPNPPRIFRVNWFRKRRGRQVPLAGLRREHARPEVDRRARRAARRSRIESPLGWMPRYEDLDWRGLDFTRSASSTS